MTQPLSVRLDPRIEKDGVTIADLREQLRHNLRVRDMVTEVNQLVATVDAAGLVRGRQAGPVVITAFWEPDPSRRGSAQLQITRC